MNVAASTAGWQSEGVVDPGNASTRSTHLSVSLLLLSSPHNDVHPTRRTSSSSSMVPHSSQDALLDSPCAAQQARLLLLLGGQVNGIQALHQRWVAMVIGTVPAIHIHSTSVLCVQDFQGVLQLLRLPQRHRKAVRLELILPAQDVAQQTHHLRKSPKFPNE